MRRYDQNGGLSRDGRNSSNTDSQPIVAKDATKDALFEQFLQCHGFDGMAQCWVRYRRNALYYA